MEALMAICRLDAPETCLSSVDAINAFDFDTVMRLAFVAGQRTAHYGPVASRAFAAYLAERLPYRSNQPCNGEHCRG